ncbi:hypothetical protein GCM10012289_52710 [Nonomuraea cavernae]|uniref:Clp R domain-containing protein n=1 Tax=Nonomuraea cavernae TaxID=2045107 RepID=A0A918DPT2_9ACTN|nr:hypothetical protein GCM10012289_52710 [Nonomuraea cavernae]
MFERFTDRARKVVVLAQQEARTMRHACIGTEHILLGLLHQDEGAARTILESFGVDLEGVRAYIAREVAPGEREPDGHIPFTPRAKKVLELSLREALQLRHTYIGTEHILLGLLREGEGLGARALSDLGVDLAEARQRLIHRVGRHRDKPGDLPFAGVSMLGERLTRIQESLDRIERHLGIRRPPGPDDAAREESG